MKYSLKLGSILVFFGMLAALSPAPNLVPEGRRIHTPVAASQNDLARFQGMAKSMPEVGVINNKPRDTVRARSTDSKATIALQTAQHSVGGTQHSGQALAALKEAQNGLDSGKSSPLSLFIWLLVAASLGYAFIFFVRHWADKNIPSPANFTKGSN
jgi:hypothetical protein